MALIKLNNRGVKDATAFGSISSLGELTFISKQTASSSATISFTSGIDSTYKEYIFYFVNMHPQTEGTEFAFNLSTDGGSNYNVAKTSTFFFAYHYESGSPAGILYDQGKDLAQGTGFQSMASDLGADSDASISGMLHLFNPSGTVGVKHFIANTSEYYLSGAVNSRANPNYIAGYGNTTSAIDAVQFKMLSGNMDSGDIILFGLN